MWNSPSVVTKRVRQLAAARAEAEHRQQRRQQSHHELVRVRPQGDVAVRIVQQPPPACAHFVGNGSSAVPFLVDQRGGIQPGLLLRVERDVGPGLMRMPGQEQSLGDSKPWRSDAPGLEMRTDFPEVRKQRRANRRAEIGGTGRSAGSRLDADRALDHLHVSIAPLLNALVQIDEPLANLGVLRIVAIHLNQHLLQLWRWLDFGVVTSRVSNADGTG